MSLFLTPPIGKRKETREKSLLEEIEKLESEEEINLPLIEEKGLSLENIRKEKMEGHIIRSRAKWVEEGEKPTRYFCNLENRNYLNKTIKKLELDGNCMNYDQARILDDVKKFTKIYIQKKIQNS